MKKLILTLSLVSGASLAAYSQGVVAFNNSSANGYVVTSANLPSSATVGAYATADNFNIQMFGLAGNVQSTTGLTGLDAFGFLNPNNLVSDGFAAANSVAAGGIGASKPSGVFDTGIGTVTGSAGHNPLQNANPGSTVVAVAAWTGNYSTFAAALTAYNAGQTYMGILAFEQQLGPGGADPTLPDLSQGWNLLPNSTQSAAQGGIGGSSQDLIMTQLAPVPEPSTMALAALGGASMLLFRRRK